jgi:hypothetical protein
MHARIRLLRDDYVLTTDPREGGDALSTVSPWEARALIATWAHDPAVRTIVRRAIAELGLLTWLNDLQDKDANAWLVQQLDQGWLYLRRTPRSELHVPLVPVSQEEEGESETPTEEDHFIEITVVDDDGNPVAGAAYSLKLPDRRILNGRTNQQGVIYIEGLDPGSCKLTLVGLDQTTWEQA